MRVAAGLKCSLQAINVVLGKMGLTYKKRHSAPASRTVRTSPGRGDSGGSSKRA
jgi:transposase